jgi:hypothetical protein
VRFARGAGALALSFALVLAWAGPAGAARPLLDSGKWDQYFALFARDTQVPWQPIAVRLDTYSGAPVDFAAYAVDPAEVIVAGAGAKPRALDVAHRTPVTRWRFTPPPGLQFESSDVAVPLQNREGFFVIEARRGDAVQQVWINLSRIGLVTKESPGGIALYGADLGTGRALAGMRITYLVNRAFVYAKTDGGGVSRMQTGNGPRPRFALAEWGNSTAFVSFVPESPLPAAVVGVRVDRASVRAGDIVRVVGFARKRTGSEMRAASGVVRLALVAGGKPLASAQPKLDEAGAFAADLLVPASTRAGDVTVLASAAGASGGATLHVDAAGDAVLRIAIACADACAPDAPIPLIVTAKRDGVPLADREVRVRVVRAPHVVAPGTAADAPQWATTTVVDTTARTNAGGELHLAIAAPTDGLASTDGIVASSGGSTASARVVAPTAKIALDVRPAKDEIDIGEPAVVDVSGFDALSGAAAAGTPVTIAIQHGPNAQTLSAVLDADGRARVTFHDVTPGANIVTAEATVEGKRAFDASGILVTPSAIGGAAVQGTSDAKLTLDRARYHVGDRITVGAALDGAAGDAFFTLEGARPFAEATTAIRAGSASTTFTVPDYAGDLAVGVTFVRDGAVVTATRTLVVDGPGHRRLTALHADKPVYAPGAIAAIGVDDGDLRGGATVAIRLTAGQPARGAAFADAPGVLALTATTSQNPASADPAWHAWVAPASSTAGDVFGFDRPRPQSAADPALDAASPPALVWRIERLGGSTLNVQLPSEPGTFVLSILKISDDGDVGAASIPLTVR